MVDFQATLYDPLYAAMGTDARLMLANYGLPVCVTVIDMSSGVEVAQGASGILTIKPAAAIRTDELRQIGIERSELQKATLDMNGKCWRVESAQPKPGPNGPSKGELYLLLAENEP